MSSLRPTDMRRARMRLALLVMSTFGALSPAFAQNSAALRFFGTGTNQQDRVRIQIDDNTNGPDASTPLDLGVGSFSIDFWIRGRLADNTSANAGGDREFFDVRWIDGNMLVDRDIFNGSTRDWGISVAGGFIRFGTGRADVNPLDQEHTLEGNVNVLDNTWRHVCVVRNAATGVKSIYIDGVLDFASPANRSRDDISFPNQGVPGQQSPWGQYIVLAAEKHDAGPAYPSFNGFMDELRFWNRALTPRDILDVYDRTAAASQVGTAGLVGQYRFEEASGTAVADSSGASSPAGTLIAGQPGNGQWVLTSQSALNTAPVSAGILPFGFARSQLNIPSLFEPTVLEVLPDGRLLICERDGTVWLYTNQTTTPTVVTQFNANTFAGERGLVGITKDPNFASNGYLYFYWTTNEPRNRVSRLTFNGSTAPQSTEFIVWQNLNTAELWHHGGSITFGPDGNLYIATGDQFDSARAQPLNTEDGKLLRLRPDGTIPADNPFINTPGARPAIYSFGHRNPFRTTWDFTTNRLYIGNVGGNSDDSWEEINLSSPPPGIGRGANYGWPNQEGPQCFISDCSAYTFPWYSYQHNNPRYFVGGPQASVTVGPVYRSTAPAAFPSTFRGNLFVADYANRWIRRLVLDSNGNILGDPLFLRSPEAQTIVDMKIAADGSMYYVIIGLDNGGNPDPGGTGVFRISYSGAAGNQPPVVTASASPTQGAPPLNVTFSSAGTFDPDNAPQPLSYSWAFGDGNFSTQPNPQHTYANRGQYTARLTVSDGSAQVQSQPIDITVGQRPTPVINAPTQGTTYRAGDVISFLGSATDPEDGPLPPSAFSWRIILAHNEHTHPFLGPLTGITAGQFTIPSTGHEPEHTNYQLQLTVTDSDGLQATAIRDILPVESILLFNTDPPGIPIFVDGVAENTPRVYESLVNFQHTIEAQQSFVLEGIPHTFVCWSDQQPRIHSFTAPEGGRTLVARYARVGGTQQTTATIAANNRNADWYTPAGSNFGNAFDFNQICAGRDSGGFFQTGMQFALDVPRNATIISAVVEVRATFDNAGAPTAVIRAYDVGNTQPFIIGPNPLTQFAPLTSASIPWNFPPFVGNQTYFTSDLSQVLQTVVNRADWSAGNFAGFVVDASSTSAGDNWRCWRNFFAGQPAILRVTYSTNQGPPPTCCPADFNSDGTVDFFDYLDFVSAFDAETPAADFNRDGSIDFFDYLDFVAAFDSGC